MGHGVCEKLSRDISALWGMEKSFGRRKDSCQSQTFTSLVCLSLNRDEMVEDIVIVE